MVGPGNFSPSDLDSNSGRLTLPDHVLPEEKEIPHSILIHGAPMFFCGCNTLNDISQVELLLA